ncbi:MAG: precorrin-6y C5,15-methyltransferase (decarboxylating) subunit CbiE [Cyanobacteria bacterium J06560_6]
MPPGIVDDATAGVSAPVIHVVGVGLDGVRGLGEDARQLVRSATLLIGSVRLLDGVEAIAPQSQERWPLGCFAKVFEDLRSRLDSQPATRAVILATGDPLFFGLGRLLLEAFPAQQLTFHPHVSAIQLAFSRLKVPWQDATLVSVHGRGEQLLSAALKRGDRKIALLTDAVLTPVAIARFLRALELPMTYQMWVCENLGGDNERVISFDPGYGPDENTFAALNVVVLLRTPQGSVPENRAHRENLPLIGLPDSVFKSYPDRPMLMTKREVRLLALGAIAPLAHQVIWDIGAGTGSVSVELSRLCPTARIYAVEKTAIGAELITQNAKRLAIAPIQVIHGKAPEVLTGLPTPDRIFIGGSGGHLIPILDGLHQQQHLREPDAARIVLTVATVEHLAALSRWLGQDAIAQTWQPQLTQVNIARSLPVGMLTRFSPLNPVTLVVLSKQPPMSAP